MSDEPKDLRIPIMMSASEVKAIDDWSFENRIRTRAEAVRRLCQLGMVYDYEIRPTVEPILKYLNEISPEHDSATQEKFKSILKEIGLAIINSGISASQLDEKSIEDAAKSIRQWHKFNRVINNKK